jgi:hypothetical protein
MIGGTMFRYLCRYNLNGLWYYGIVEEHHEDTKKEAERGHTLVSDLVRPTLFSVKNSDVVDIPHGLSGKWDEALGFFWGGGEAEDYRTLAWLAAEIKERTIPNDGKLHVGHQFSIGVADGSAHYVVTSIKGKACQVEWRGWCEDRWTDHHFGWGGRFSVADITRYVRPGRQNLFGKNVSVKDLVKKYDTLLKEFKEKYVGHLAVDVR